MVLNATFNNISVILWRSVLLVEETWVPGENHRLAINHWLCLSHNNHRLAINHWLCLSHNNHRLAINHWLCLSHNDHRLAINHWLNLSHNIVSSTPCLSGIWTHNVMGTDCIGSYKSNYHTIMTMKAYK
jgi:hypothetical protein